MLSILEPKMIPWEWGWEEEHKDLLAASAPLFRVEESHTQKRPMPSVSKKASFLSVSVFPKVPSAQTPSFLQVRTSPLPLHYLELAVPPKELKSPHISLHFRGTLSFPRRVGGETGTLVEGELKTSQEK